MVSVRTFADPRTLRVVLYWTATELVHFAARTGGPRRERRLLREKRIHGARARMYVVAAGTIETALLLLNLSNRTARSRHRQ